MKKQDGYKQVAEAGYRPVVSSPSLNQREGQAQCES